MSQFDDENIKNVISALDYIIHGRDNEHPLQVKIEAIMTLSSYIPNAEAINIIMGIASNERFPLELRVAAVRSLGSKA